MNAKKWEKEVLLWTALVLIVSYLCYLPMLLKREGVPISEAIVASKYLFIVVPLAISIFCILKHKQLRNWLSALFAEKIGMHAILCCVVLAVVGLSFSAIYYLIAGDKNSFSSIYSTVISAVVSCGYFFITAVIEELAWRGFLLSKLSMTKGKTAALIYVGIVWTIWHIPMWAVRNSLEFGEILVYSVWTILVSIVLGLLFFRYKSIFVVSLSHMLFNTCFFAPIEYNTILLALILLLSFPILKRELRGSPKKD